MIINISESFQKSGVYGLISFFVENNSADDSPRVIAYKLLKASRDIAKKSKDQRLNYLPPIAFDLNGHESIYRMAALLYIELDNFEEALKCVSYLHYYYADEAIEPHEQFNVIKQHLSDSYTNDDGLNSAIEEYQGTYQQQRVLNNIKDYQDIMPSEDIIEQKVYFKRLYRRFGVATIISTIEKDMRFNDRAKAIILIRAGRTIGDIASEGPSVETLFANKALELDNSDTVVNNSYQAYLRAGDLNKIQQLKSQYSHII